MPKGFIASSLIDVLREHRDRLLKSLPAAWLDFFFQ